MLFLLSPAKSLDFDTPWEGVAHSEPLFSAQTAKLIKILRQKTQPELARLMDLSDSLAALNVARYQAWSRQPGPHVAKPAVLAFHGNAYQGLDVKTLQPRQLAWAQQHVAILSGLYGLLRPLDLIQPHRLEMGTALANPKGPNLYEFWGADIASQLQQNLLQHKTPVIVNLASKEYFKSVQGQALSARVIECVFEEGRAGRYKVIGIMAKRARGLMARYAIVKQVKTPAALEKFNLEGYAFCPDVSHPDRLVFRRTPG